MNIKKKPLKRPSTILFGLLFSSIFGGNPISIDGNFDDWEGISTSYIDYHGDAQEADFYKLKITHDNEFLFIYLKFYDGEFLMQNWNEFHLYIDSDNDSTTGYNYHGIGAELAWNFGSRLGYVYIDDNQSEISQNDLNLRIAPTITSSEFEIGIALESSALTLNGEQVLLNGTLFMSEIEFGGDFIPDDRGGILFSISDSLINEPELISLEKRNVDDIRIVSYNTLSEGIIDIDRQIYFKRIFQALEPDVIVLQEHNEWQIIGDIIQSWFPEDEWNSSWTYNDLVIFSRFAVLDDALMSSGRTMVALLDTEAELGNDLLIFNSHLSCCDNNEDRQSQVDIFTQEWKEWVNDESGPFEIEYGISFIHAGDFNFVGYRQQVETIRMGDIYNEGQYGNDFLPDWDMSSLKDLSPRHTNKLMNYTWRNDASSFNPGKLDYIFFSDATIIGSKNYILNTLSMNDYELNYYGLERNDTQEASDHLPVVFDILTHESMKLLKSNEASNFLMLYPNYPNPFNLKTQIKFSLTKSSNISIEIIDIRGFILKTIFQGIKAQGTHSLYWDSTDKEGSILGSGVYFIVVKGENFSKKQKVLLVK
ncbi:MAG: T9SS type A sorting domain-containing protein [Candidatus Neomarinimicrobiota bacterium]